MLLTMYATRMKISKDGQGYRLYRNVTWFNLTSNNKPFPYEVGPDSNEINADVLNELVWLTVIVVCIFGTILQKNTEKEPNQQAL